MTLDNIQFKKHLVYREPILTDRYLNSNSHHHLIQLPTLGKSLFQTAQHLYDADHLEAELEPTTRPCLSSILRTNRIHPKR